MWGSVWGHTWNKRGLSARWSYVGARFPRLRLLQSTPCLRWLPSFRGERSTMTFFPRYLKLPNRSIPTDSENSYRRMGTRFSLGTTLGQAVAALGPSMGRSTTRATNKAGNLHSASMNWLTSWPNELRRCSKQAGTESNSSRIMVGYWFQPDFLRCRYRSISRPPAGVAALSWRRRQKWITPSLIGIGHRQSGWRHQGGSDASRR